MPEGISLLVAGLVRQKQKMAHDLGFPAKGFSGRGPFLCFYRCPGCQQPNASYAQPNTGREQG